MAVPLTGCIKNMDDLKVALGVNEVPPPPPPLQPPAARAQANATSVTTGLPVRFTAEANDPQGLALTYSWRFSDGQRADGAIVVHAFLKPGEQRAELTVTNAEGLAAGDDVVVQVAQANRAPLAAISVRGADGALAGDAIAFDASGSGDPDNDLLRYEWDMGDGATSRAASVEHAYARPGVYDVTLDVIDPSGLFARASQRVVVGGEWSFDGRLELAGAQRAQHKVFVAEGARLLGATLSFPTAFGTNDLRLILLDPAGEEVARSAGTSAPGEDGTAKRTVEALSEAIAAHGAGEWTLVVELAQGFQVDYALDVREALK